MNRTEHVFSSTAATYDAARVKLIPGFNDFYASAIALLSEDHLSVLDLGAGTGLLSAFVRQRLPCAHLHLIDTSRAMLDQARTRLANDRMVCFTLADYTSDPLGSSYDAIVSALSIHHLPDAAKQDLFVRIFAALNAGGIFINAEQILQPTPALEAAARDQWLAEVRACGATEQQIADSLLRQTEDRCATVEDQLAWLRQAGFAEPACTYLEGRFAVMHARRASQDVH